MKLIIQAIKALKRKLENRIKNSAADWGQNDSNSDSYIKNRTHYKEKRTEVCVENLSSYEYKLGMFPKCNFIPGYSYTVILNGITYNNLICYCEGDYNIIASRSPNAPFYIDDNGGDGLYIEGIEDENYTISIYKNINIVHKIDKEYIPDDIRSYLLLNDTSNGKKYELTIRDGTLTTSLVGSLEDFEYITNPDGTYTITGWKGTLYGEPSTEMILPPNVII